MAGKSAKQNKFMAFVAKKSGSVPKGAKAAAAKKKKGKY